MAKRKTTSAIGIDEEYQAQDDLRTLRNAERIRSDPKRLKRATTYAQQEVAALSKVTGGTKQVSARKPGVARSVRSTKGRQHGKA